MRISDTICKAMNDQIAHELDSAYRYLAMSAWCNGQGLPGAARWLRSQAEEELGHAMKFFDFIQARDGQPILQALPQPPAEFPDVRAVFTAAPANAPNMATLRSST